MVAGRVHTIQFEIRNGQTGMGEPPNPVSASRGGLISPPESEAGDIIQINNDFGTTEALNASVETDALNSESSQIEQLRAAIQKLEAQEASLKVVSQTPQR
jgi:hypothetical protein